MSGFSFRTDQTASPWLGADRLFTTPELQRRYDSVEIALLTPKFTLVPAHFFRPEEARTMLSEVVALRETDAVETVPVPAFGAVLVYSNSIDESLSRVLAQTVFTSAGEQARVLPEVFYLLEALPDIREYNKILASWRDGFLHLVIAQGKSLLLCNSFAAMDFTTAEYFIFLSLKKLQLNPEVSSAFFRTPLAPDEEMSLYRYFKSVEAL